LGKKAPPTCRSKRKKKSLYTWSKEEGWQGGLNGTFGLHRKRGKRKVPRPQVPFSGGGRGENLFPCQGKKDALIYGGEKVLSEKRQPARRKRTPTRGKDILSGRIKTASSGEGRPDEKGSLSSLTRDPILQKGKSRKRHGVRREKKKTVDHRSPITLRTLPTTSSKRNALHAAGKGKKSEKKKRFYSSPPS